MNWVRLYRAMYLKTLNEVSREQRPSLGGKDRHRGLRLLTGPASPSPTALPALPDDSRHTLDTGHAGGEGRDH